MQRRANVQPLMLNYGDMNIDTTMSSKDMATMSIEGGSALSLYDCDSPQHSPRASPFSPCVNMELLSPECSPQWLTVGHDTITLVNKRASVDEIDGNSVDSGYSTSSFKFAEPKLPRRLEPSLQPFKNHSIAQLQYQHGLQAHHQHVTPPKSYQMSHSLSSGSMESMGDDYMDLFEMESLDEVSGVTSNLNSLISGDIKSIKTTPDMKRPLVRRCLSLNENNLMNRIRGSLFEPKTPENLKVVPGNTTPYSSRTPIERCFKRPDPSGISPIQSKRLKCEIDDKENQMLTISPSLPVSVMMIGEVPVTWPLFKKSMSMNDAHIMTALSRSVSEPALIGDFSRPFCLPLTEGKHPDLKSISSDTMARLLRGDFTKDVASFKIIDCRYPYEFDGGHIHGAYNLYTHKQILEELVKNCKTEIMTSTKTAISTTAASCDGRRRHILVFHCEFSSERGPKLSRFLRSHDRQRNTSIYPALQYVYTYTEIYLLDGGYKEFFKNYSELCDPIAYRPMLDPSYGAYNHTNK